MRPDNERNKMKTMQIHTAVTAAMALLGVACVSPAFGEPSAAQTEKEFHGSITTVNAPENCLTVKGYFLTRNFNTAGTCEVSLQDKPMAALTDLRPGQKVDIRYDEDKGVLIARHIAQHDIIYSGHITAIDPATRKLTLKEGVLTRNLDIAPDCAVVLKDNKPGMLDSLQVGDAVHVVYEPVKGAHMASRIEQKSETFAGTIQAIDATTRTVKAKDFLTEKKFNLADDCSIVINGKPYGSLSDLRIGDEVTFNYQNADGVLVASRVSPMPAATATKVALSPKSASQLPNYSYTAP